MSAFRDSSAPTPKPPPLFSPMRPLKVLAKKFGGWLLWWFEAPSWTSSETYRSGKMEPESTPTGYGCLSLFILTSTVLPWTILYAVDVYMGGGAWTPWPVYIVSTLTLLRAWLPAAMHLDNPESLQWWKDKIS